MQGNPHVRFDEQGVETDRLVSPTGEPYDTAPPPDSTPLNEAVPQPRRERPLAPKPVRRSLPSRRSACALI